MSPRYLLLIVFLLPFLLGYAGASYTWSKLERMRQIRGFKPGARVETKIVTNVWEDDKAFWISFSDGIPGVASDEQINLPKHVWQRYGRGDEIEIVFLPGDNSAYHREDFYADDGNFAFDYGLLAIEIGMIVFAIVGASITFWVLRRSERISMNTSSR